MGRKQTELVVGSMLALVVLFFVGGLVAIVAMGQFRADIDPLKLPEYFWFYRHNGYVMTWLAKGMGAAALAAGLAWVAIKYRKPALHGAARFANRAEIRKEGLFDKGGIVVGELGSSMLRFGGTEHVLLEAPTRAGKGVSVVIPNLLTWEDSVVVLDIKKENYEVTARFREKVLEQAVFLFDPLDKQGRTARYNPLGYIDRTDPVAVINELQKVAVMLIVQSQDGDQFFDDAARTAFVGIAAYVAATPDLPFTMGEIYRQFATPAMQLSFAKVIERRRAGPDALSGPCVTAIRDFINSSPNTFTSIRQTVTSRLAIWVNPYVDAATSECDFDFRTFRDRKVSLYVGVIFGDLERLSPLLSLMFQQLIDLNVRALPTATRHRVRILTLLDEFPQLGRMTVIQRGFAFVAGYGIRIVPVIQSMAQLRMAYTADGAEDIASNCGLEIVLRPKRVEQARDISERIGYYSYRARSTSRKEFESFGRSISESDQRRALMLPQEVLQMPAEEMLIFRAGIPPIKANRLIYWKDDRFTSKVLGLPTLPRARPLAVRAAAAVEACAEVDDDVAAEGTVAAELLPDEALAAPLGDVPDLAEIERLVAAVAEIDVTLAGVDDLDEGADQEAPVDDDDIDRDGREALERLLKQRK